MESVAVLASGKCRRRYSPEHPLFAAGNALRVLKYRQDGGSELLYDECGEDDGLRGDERDVFQCRLLTCNVGFRSLAAYEEHYDLVHRNVCMECYRSFMSLRLLDIHISEMHDAFFKVLSKKKPMYTCLVDGCENTFTHDDKRSRHLVQVHQYPVGFSFHRPRRIQSNALSSKQAEKKKKQPRKKKECANVKNRMEIDQAAQHVEGHEGSVSEVTEPEVSERCGRASANSVEQGAATDIEMVDELAEDMRNLRIPKTLSFGRKQRWRR